MKKQRVLFLCTGNSCRSQMAEGLANNLLGERVEAFSAGTETTQVNPLLIRALAEIGVDANEKCPLFFGGVKRMHIGFDDPSRLLGSEEKVLPEYRRVRDEIKTVLCDFFDKELVA